MCAQFVLKTKAQKIAEDLGVLVPQALMKEFDLRARGFIKTDRAPVILAEKGKLVLKEMMFSLCPSWSAEFPFKWSSYNARMERPKFSKDKKPVIDPTTNLQKSEHIYEVPTWREAFNRGQTCLVPMNIAIESSYFGSHAGHMIQFSQSNQEVFYAVGLWSSWLDKQTGELKDTFTLITDDPDEFFFKAGHDRSLFVIRKNAISDWLLRADLKPVERFQLLRKNRISLDWKVESERAMAKGWNKRAPSPEEIASVKVWSA